MIIPYQKLQEDTLLTLIQEFIMREGTDYGHGEYSIEAKITQVLQQIKAGKVDIVFDPEEQSFNLVVRGQHGKK